MSNPLDPVLRWYNAARDCMRVTRRVLEKSIPQAITDKHLFHSMTLAESLSEIENARTELDNLAVVAMVAVFERTLRRYLIGRITPALPTNDVFDTAVQEQVARDVEYWHISARVIDEVFKNRVPADLCGMIKQIIDHRNEVAHGHVIGTPPPAYADPPTSFSRLTDFLRAGGILTP